MLQACFGAVVSRANDRLFLTPVPTPPPRCPHCSADRTVYYKKFPVTGPSSQVPVGWVTITGRRAFCCGGLACCYCGLGKAASYVAVCVW